jgi:hypothetical protein
MVRRSCTRRKAETADILHLALRSRDQLKRKERMERKSRMNTKEHKKSTRFKKIARKRYV